MDIKVKEKLLVSVLDIKASRREKKEVIRFRGRRWGVTQSQQSPNQTYRKFWSWDRLLEVSELGLKEWDCIPHKSISHWVKAALLRDMTVYGKAAALCREGSSRRRFKAKGSLSITHPATGKISPSFMKDIQCKISESSIINIFHLYLSHK